MAEFGWAFIECDESGSGGLGSGACDCAQGPDGALQFHTGSGGMSGSARLTWDDVDSELYLSGTLSVSGTINADVLNVNELNVNTTNKTVVNIETSGSTKFGDTADDTHQFTGSVYISGNLENNGNTKFGDDASDVHQYTGSVYISGNLEANGNTKFGDSASDVHQFSGSVNVSGAFNLNGGLSLGGGVSFNYYKLTSTPYTVQDSDYIIGVSGSGAFVINLPSASAVEAGRVIYIKDEEDFGATGRPPAVSIDITPAGSNLIDGESIYEIENGDFAAISLYSDGASNWFII